VTVFRPAARTVAPDGREWEIYAYKLRRAPRPAGERRRRLRRLVELVSGAVRALAADEWTVEAVSWAPYPLRHKWTTTREYRGQVLAQVEGSLERGQIPLPRNAFQRSV
jgi:hypothetical protein